MTQEILDELCNYLPSVINGLELLIQMKNNNEKNWKQKEFIAFHLEKVIKDFLISKGFIDKWKNGKGPSGGNADIDTFYEYPIDIKIKFKNGNTPLNDKRTIDKSLEIYGKFGIIEVVCSSIDDSDYFITNFQNELKGSRKKNQGRKCKFGCILKEINYYEALNTSNFILFHQGKNSNGKPRNIKYLLEEKTPPSFSSKKLI